MSKRLFVGLILLVSIADATTLVSVSNPDLSSAAIDSDVVRAVSFSLDQGFDGVDISAWLGGPSPVTAYLTTRIGLGTTIADEIAAHTFVPHVYPAGRTQTSFDGFGVNIIFGGLTLPAGTYYLTLSGVTLCCSIGEVDWLGGSTTFSSPNAHAISSSLFADGLNSLVSQSFAPASTFADNLLLRMSDPSVYPYRAMYSVESGAPSSIPEPKTYFLVTTGLGFIGILYFRKRRIKDSTAQFDQFDPFALFRAVIARLKPGQSIG